MPPSSNGRGGRARKGAQRVVREGEQTALSLLRAAPREPSAQPPWTDLATTPTILLAATQETC